MSGDYWTWVASEAGKINSDGCSCVSEYRQACCFEHDLAYYYGRDPRSAYTFLGSWELAAKISRSSADARFRECHQEMSRMGKLSPMSFWRFLGVRIGGLTAWNRHRKLRP